MAATPACHFFQMGNCKQGADCQYAHVADPTFRRKPCTYFARGTCRRGDTCTYSHNRAEIDAAKNIPNTSGTTGDSTTSSEAAFREWRYQIPVGDRLLHPRKLGPALNKFWNQAAGFVSGDTGIMQETIERLASEGGALRVKETVEQVLPDLTLAELGRLYNQQFAPLFKTITHPTVANSTILASRVMSIYNVMYGSDGHRACSFFAGITQYLQTLDLVDPDAANAPNLSTADAFETTMAALDKLVEINTAAQVHDGLKTVVEAMKIRLEKPLPDGAAYAYANALKHLRRIRQRLGLGLALNEMTKATPEVGGKLTFELERERPGALSEEGPRHDNDSTDIRQISILPTLSEIQSSRTEYLPLSDPREWHLPGLKGLLDRHFRLLREDTVGQLRDAAKFELERLQNPETQESGSPKRQGVRTFIYEDVTVQDRIFDSHNGMLFVLSFLQPKNLAKKTKGERRDWWQGSKRLGYDALICLLSSGGSAIFLVVVPEPQRGRKDSLTGEKVQSIHEYYDLYSDDERSHVIAKAVRQADIPSLLYHFAGTSSEVLSLVEYPGVILQAFKPTLEALQQMTQTMDVPFANILAPDLATEYPSGLVEVGPAPYAMKPNFRYDLTSILQPGTELHYTAGRDVEDAITELSEKSSLDHGQAGALIQALTRALALIQGPPGTGKSYTGMQLAKVLLAHRRSAGLGPLIWVTFTNFALDSSLSRLADDGVTNIVRVGGNSKCERLQDVNLRVLAQQLDMTKTEKSDRYNLVKKIDGECREINRILKDMNQVGEPDLLRRYLETHFPEVCHPLFADVDENGWETVDYSKGAQDTVQRWLRGSPLGWGNGRPRSVDQLWDVHIHHMTGQERRLLYDFWIAEMRDMYLSQFEQALEEYNEHKRKLDGVQTELNLRVLRQANIIGLTTSGLARHLDLLRRTGAKILIAEEAGEILEAHCLTAFLPTVEHAILIGDHQQLRPHVQNYELSCESKNGAQYALDVSLFERLVSRPYETAQLLPFSTLDTQRRMHPSISQLIRETIYPSLKDAAFVSRYPEVCGMRKRLFWLNHEHDQDTSTDPVSTSHTNEFEAVMVTALVQHCIAQGVYKSDDIAVITPYLGQLRKLRQKLGASMQIVLNDRDVADLEKEGESDPEINDVRDEATARRSTIARGTLLKAVRLATIDNFQGEEAKVVVVSLVRKNKPGFLRTSNRINVLLSRAQHGMYIIGNAATMAQVPMWSSVLDIFRAEGNIGDALELCCPRHPDVPVVVNNPEDFLRLSPEGGCQLACDRILTCGHACTSLCHSEMLHNAVFCTKACPRVKEGCLHACDRPCGMTCAKECEVIVEDVDKTLPCGHHKNSLPCYQYQDLTRVRCEEEVDRTVPGCLHTKRVPCYVNVESLDFKCSSACGSQLSCGHLCMHACFRCRTKDEDGKISQVDHGKCKSRCGRAFSACAHTDTSPCHGDKPCDLCKAPCDTRCSHGRCDKKCYESCAPCMEETCASRCPHSACRQPCSAPCDHLPCGLRCEKTLKCGHRCPSICGEVCPTAKFCQICSSEEIKAQQADLVMLQSYWEVELDEDPCIFTTCGHIVTLSSLDGIFDMLKYYDVDDSGRIVAIKAKAGPFSSDDMKRCPHCRGSLRNIARYGRIVRRALLDESAKRLTIWAEQERAGYAERLSMEQAQLLASLDKAFKPNQDVKLQGTVNDQIREIKRLKTIKRYQGILNLRTQISNFATKLRKEEMPYQKVHDCVEMLRRRDADAGIAAFEVSSEELQMSQRVQAVSLMLQLDVILIADIVAMHDRTAAGRAKGVISLDLADNRNNCANQTNEAMMTHNVREQVQGLIFWARFAALECGICNPADEEAYPGRWAQVTALSDEAIWFLEIAEQICRDFAGSESNITKGLAEEIADVRRMLNDGVSAGEMRMVVEVMAQEFRGTGHWYRCANGHPFTVGECGMPMELARCPACGSGIGGQHHQPTEGVQHATDIERDFGAMRL